MSAGQPRSIQWFGHKGTLDRESRSVRFYGEIEGDDEAATVNVAVRWEALEALEVQQTEVRDSIRYIELFEANRDRFEAIASRLLAEGSALQRGYLVIGPEHL